ncbi:hypothetical protein JCM6882_006689 [Rhodosporidiobolus microsporus]
MSSSINDLLQESLDTAHRAWDNIADPSLANLHELPSKVASSLQDAWAKITNNGTLGGVPNPRDWLPEQLAPAPPPPPPAPTHRSAVWLDSLAKHLARHPAAYSFAAVGLTGSASYYLFPRQTLVALSPITRLVPLTVLPDPKNRPLRLLPAQHGVAGEVRKEAVVVLGADSPVGRELALEMERRGFVVIATVKEPVEVYALERMSRGWMKVLVLDPNDSSSVSPFLRSLSTALSLRFPLHTSGDPFSRPAHALALTGVVNCLSLSSVPEALAPLEAVENDAVKKLVGERISTVVGVVKGVLPFLRTAASRPGAPAGSFVSLVPSSSSNLSLPFLSLTSAGDAALSSLFHSLRRELSASSGPSVHLTILETGFFHLPDSPQHQTSSPRTAQPAPLPIRLESVYAPALARRAPPPAVQQGETGARTKCASRKGSEVRRLSRRVFKILVRPANASAVERVGAGSRTYLLVSLLPHSLVDLCLTIHDRLYGLYLSHLSKRLAAVSARLPSSSRSSSSSRSGRPLPTPPAAQQQHPESLRPSTSPTTPSQVPVADSFARPSSEKEKEKDQQDAAETGSQSSLEDFGPLGGSQASMGGSFVSVGREELA